MAHLPGTPSSVEITVILESSGTGYTIHLIDNGIGMNANEQKLAFDKFYRAESGDVHNIKGFGLGLSYVKSIIEKHNGQVELSSTKNKGTTVTQINWTDFATSAVDIAGYKTDDNGTFLGTIWYPKLRVNSFSVNIGDPEALIERNFGI